MRHGTRTVNEAFAAFDLLDSLGVAIQPKEGFQPAKYGNRNFGQFEALENKLTRDLVDGLLADLVKPIFDHEILFKILKQYIADQDIVWLLNDIICSFNLDVCYYTTKYGSICPKQNRGLPLGNLTSQLFVNIYMNQFDQFIKHKLKAKYYIRYADDFMILSQDRQELINQLAAIKEFLQLKLQLTLHPSKIVLKIFASGVDFLGWVNFPKHKVLRTSSKKRMLRKIIKHLTEETLQSYLGLLFHGNTNKLTQEILNHYWLLKTP